MMRRCSSADSYDAADFDMNTIWLNTACSGRLGFAAFFELFLGLGSFPFPGLFLPSPSPRQRRPLRIANHGDINAVRNMTH